MPTYLYCLLSPAADAEPSVTARGIGGGPVRALSTGTLEAWVSTVATPPPSAGAEGAQEHDAVVTAAMRTGRTPLPARFGQVWPSDVACAAALESRADKLRPLLSRVAGMVEMTVCTVLPGMPRAAAAPAPADETAPGRAYLQHLRARADRERHVHAALEGLRARVSEAVGALAHGEVAEIRGTEDALALFVSYLIARNDELHFRRAVDDVDRTAAPRLVVAGPRAPYSFA